MANRTYLYCSEKPVKYIELDAAIVISAASYMVPVFWYMLFDTSDIEKASTPGDDDEPDFKYYRLVADRASSIECAKQRIDSVSSLLGAKIAEQFNQFLGLIEQQSGEKVVVETCELAMMDESPRTFKGEAIKCMKAFSQEPIVRKGLFRKESTANPNWVALLGQANISTDTEDKPIESLCGYSWKIPVPWETGTA
ncbi:hypothetical protein [Nitrincola sp. MINF-07-Sa-05]|uniref:hypothetical protein n=1 Tax=Nitrincola salilacus TaxID=3400273 RepID=UPI0039184423